MGTELVPVIELEPPTYTTYANSGYDAWNNDPLICTSVTMSQSLCG